jgi:hypothetical protein
VTEGPLDLGLSIRMSNDGLYGRKRTVLTGTLRHLLLTAHNDHSHTSSLEQNTPEPLPHSAHLPGASYTLLYSSCGLVNFRFGVRQKLESG